jgi:hypothetical protein
MASKNAQPRPIQAVGHPESMSLPDDERGKFVVWTNQDCNLVEAEQVARVSVKRRLPQ